MLDLIDSYLKSQTPALKCDLLLRTFCYCYCTRRRGSCVAATHLLESSCCVERWRESVGDTVKAKTVATPSGICPASQLDMYSCTCTILLAPLLPLHLIH